MSAGGEAEDVTRHLVRSGRVAVPEVASCPASCPSAAHQGTRLVASVSPIVRDGEAAREFYADALGLPFVGGEGDHVFTEHLDGVEHLGAVTPE